MECMGTFMECPDMSIHGMQWSNTTGVDFTEVNPGFISLFNNNNNNVLFVWNFTNIAL